MAQLRQDYPQFQARNTEILAIGPDGPNAFKNYWEINRIPFVGMADIKSKVADAFCQEVNILKFGRMPAMFIIDLHGIIRFSHYGNSMSDIPPNKEILELLDELKGQPG
jgi:peroxiredoxin